MVLDFTLKLTLKKLPLEFWWSIEENIHNYLKKILKIPLFKKRDGTRDS